MKRKIQEVNGKQFYTANKHQKWARSAANVAAKHGPTIAKVGRRILQRLKSKYSKRTNKSSSRIDLRATLQGISTHNDLSEIKPKHYLIGKEKQIKGSATFKLTHINQGVNNGTQGKQFAGCTTQIMNKYHMRGTASDITTDDANYGTKFGTSPWTLNPLIDATNTTIYSATPSAVTDDDKFHLAHVDSYYDLINLSATSVKLDIYFYLASETASNDPSACWTAALTAKQYLQPAQAAGPTTIAALPTLGFPVKEDLGEKPSLKEVKRFWKLLRHKTLILQGGDTIKMAHRYIYNKTLSYKEINMTGGDFVENWSIVPMIVQNGALIGYEADGASAGALATQVSFSDTKVGWVSKDIYTFKAIQPNRFSIKRSEVGILQNTSNRPTFISVEDTKIEGDVHA